MRFAYFLSLLIILSCSERTLITSSLTDDISLINEDTSYTDTDTSEYRFQTYEVCERFEIELSTDNDKTDFYIPRSEDLFFTLIILLQGSDLPKENYSKIANLLCKNGFVVAIPDHYKESFSGRHLYSEENTTNEIFRAVIGISQNSDSPLFKKVDTDRLILFGHSYGAGCGLFMINNECKWPFCSTEYQRIPQLIGGIFYGVNLKSPYGENYYEINNSEIPIMLISGENDGAIKYEYAKKSFDYITSPPKAFVGLKNANHYAINDTNPPPGGDADKNPQSLAQNTGLQIISDISTAFIFEHILRIEDFKGYFMRVASKFNEFISFEVQEKDVD